MIVFDIQNYTSRHSIADCALPQIHFKVLCYFSNETNNDIHPFHIGFVLSENSRKDQIINNFISHSVKLWFNYIFPNLCLDDLSYMHDVLDVLNKLIDKELSCNINNNRSL